MLEFTASLLREKFILSEDRPLSEDDDPTHLIALSNRIQIDLPGRVPEEFVIRAHNMHVCTRMIVRLLQNFQRLGAIMNRPTPHDWESDWDICVNDYERFYNPDLWGAVYFEGKLIFEAGDHHPFLDLIEKCAHEHDGAYEESVVAAENAFKASGKDIKVHYDSNVALVLDMAAAQCRCGIIHRSPTQTTTFSFGAYPREKDEAINIPQIIGSAAAYLEGIQLAFMIGMNNVKMVMGIIERFSHEEKQTREAKKRMARINTEISNMEAIHDIRYRPEKPSFTQITNAAETLAENTLEPPPRKPILSEGGQGEIEEGNPLDGSGKLFS